MDRKKFKKAGMTALASNLRNYKKTAKPKQAKSFVDEWVKCRGDFELIVRDNNGAVVPKMCVSEKNLVVSVARRVMSRLIAGAVSGAAIINTGGTTVISNVNELFIDKMVFGTGGHNPAIPTEALVPDMGEEALTTPIVSPASKLVTIDYPSDTAVRFIATLDQTEANGIGLSEEALVTNGGFMFAKKNFGLVTKTDDFSFEFRHTILF